MRRFFPPDCTKPTILYDKMQNGDLAATPLFSVSEMRRVSVFKPSHRYVDMEIFSVRSVSSGLPRIPSTRLACQRRVRSSAPQHVRPAPLWASPRNAHRSPLPDS